MKYISIDTETDKYCKPFICTVTNEQLQSKLFRLPNQQKALETYLLKKQKYSKYFIQLLLIFMLYHY